MKNRGIILTLFITACITLVVTGGFVALFSNFATPLQAEGVATKSVAQDITAVGSIHSENEATLHFQTGGELVYLPFKEGDSVSAGQTVAALDQRAIVDALQTAAKTADNQQLSFDSVNDFNGDRNLSDTGLSVSARRQLQTALNSLDQTKLAVEIQKIAQEQAVLTSPITGIITHEDVTTPNVNVTPTTSFSVADPTTKVFRAFVRATDVDFVSVGSSATIHMDGTNKTFAGTIEKVYPQKQTLPSGDDAYQVDIQSSDLSHTLFGQTGSVTIKSNNQTASLMVPSWTILGHSSLWVIENNKPVLKSVIIGKTHDDFTEITGGLSQEDKIILDPEKVAKESYPIL